MGSKKELERQIKLFQAVIDNLPFDAWFKDWEGRYHVINKSFESYANKGKDEIIGKTDFDIYPEEEAEIYVKSDLNTIKNQKSTHHEGWLPSKMYKEEGKTPIYDVDGNLKGTAGFSRDITEKEKNEQALMTSEDHFRTIFELAPLGMAIFDTITGLALEVNGTYCEIIGRSEEEIKKTPWWEYSHPDEIEKNRHELKNMQKKACRSFAIEKKYLKPDNSIVWVKMSNAVFEENKKGNHTHICMIEDITERKVFEEKILYLNYYDQLTGVYNRRYYEMELKNLNQKKNMPIALIMADVNGLKLTNDAFGHIQGDQLLKTVSRVLNKVCKNNGFVARIGGDEFILILHNTDSKEASKTVKIIQDKLLKKRSDKILFSVSFGWSIKETVSQNFKDIFSVAEDHMYKNKVSESSSMRSETIKIITNTLYEKNEREQLHCERVSNLCESIGRAMGMSIENINELKTAGLLHDIGKVGIDEQILNKSGKLTELEWAAIKRHPEVGFQILRSIKEFVHISEFALYHHERIDGKGYPSGLKDEDIPIPAKIICIADAYDAMTNVRTYKNVMSKEEAAAEIRKNAGIQFDKEITDIFISKVIPNDSTLPSMEDLNEF